MCSGKVEPAECTQSIYVRICSFILKGCFSLVVSLLSAATRLSWTACWVLVVLALRKWHLHWSNPESEMFSSYEQAVKPLLGPISQCRKLSASCGAAMWMCFISFLRTLPKRFSLNFHLFSWRWHPWHVTASASLRALALVWVLDIAAVGGAVWIAVAWRRLWGIRQTLLIPCQGCTSVPYTCLEAKPNK